jgi:hypothetical protein
MLALLALLASTGFGQRIAALELLKLLFQVHGRELYP